MSLQDKEEMVRYIWLHYVLFYPHAALEQFKKGMLEIMVEVSVEAEGMPKPCCVAENLFLLVF